VSVFSDVHDVTRESRGFAGSLQASRDKVVVRLAGELDICVAEDVQALLDCAAVRAAPTTIVDLSDVTFIDAHSIGLILAAWESTLRQGRTLGVKGAHGVVAELLDWLGPDDLVINAGAGRERRSLR
jgi:anti-anti-sigma factor